MKISLFSQEIAFRTEFPGSNFLLPTFLTGGKWEFEVANLLLATVNFEPCKLRFMGTLPCFFKHFSKGNNFFDFLFAFLDYKALLKGFS